MAAPPEVAVNAGLFVNEGGTALITSSNLQISDADTPSASLIIEITESCHWGNVFRNGSPISTGDTFSQSDIDAGNISYGHDGVDCPDVDFFVFTASDESTSLEGRVFKVTILPIDDFPVIAHNDLLVVDRGCGVQRVSAGELGALDLDTPDTDLVYQIDAAPIRGELQLSGLILGVGSAFTQEDVHLGRLSYHFQGGSWTADSASLTLADGAGASLPGITLGVVFTDAATGVAEPARANLSAALFHTNPNPFNPSTTISYALPAAGHVELTVYDLAGRTVKVLVSEHVTAGEHEVPWNGRDEDDNQVASGVYLYQLRAGDFVETKRMVLVK